MVSQVVQIKNPLGLHARPANNFVKLAIKYKSNISFTKDQKNFNAKSILSVMAAGARQGSTIELICDGEDEQSALQTLVEAVESGLGE